MRLRMTNEKHEQFYTVLTALTNKVNKRDILYIIGYFNAKTDSAHKDYPENMGRYGKGEVNENGTRLLEFCSQHSLVPTNTKFKHKLCHRTTWQAPVNPTAKRRDDTPARTHTET